MGLRTFKIVDARGAPKRIPYASSWSILVRRPYPLIFRARSLVWVQSPQFGRLARLWLWAMTALAAAASMLGWFWDQSLMEAIALAVFAVGVGYAAVNHRRFVAEFIARHHRRHGPMPAICPACAYDLHGVPVADDGCTPCPECGAAWRVADSPYSPHE